MTNKHNLLKGLRKGIDKSMIKINLRDVFFKSRVQCYFVIKQSEQKYRNEFNKDLNNCY